MRKLLILTVPILLTAGTSGCFHNCCGPGLGGGLFASQRPQQRAVQCCQPCCDPCATTTVMPVTQMMPAVPCCQ